MPRGANISIGSTKKHRATKQASITITKRKHLTTPLSKRRKNPAEQWMRSTPPKQNEERSSDGRRPDSLSTSP
eukprot:12367492-Prorocentrum_lima.AAC.1